MPDLIQVFSRKWKFILGLTLLATIIALVAVWISPKKYLSTATALPVNSLVADKARIFNPNIEMLYSDFGSPDELDRIEGTAMLDTIFIAAVKKFDLASHYGFGRSEVNEYKAVVKLKKESNISRSAYGELKVKVWDEEKNMAANLANALMQDIQDLHQHLQTENTRAALQQLMSDYQEKKIQFAQFSDSTAGLKGPDSELASAKKAAMLDQLQQYEKMTDQFKVAISSNPRVLLIVENARPAHWPDKPKVLVTLLLSFFGAFLFFYLLALFLETRKRLN
jgi:uncharacterized protein involved in exopolysaccharide biosynthesis